MMKRILLALTACGFAATAHATPETAEDWGARASALYGETTSLLTDVKTGQNTQLSADYTDALANFSIIAGRLAIWVDETGGARDFGCIYRGMAEEAEIQLDALETAKSNETAEAALTRIATMLDDAQSIAVASAHAARNGNTNAAPTGHCPASAISLDQYLTEQP